MSNQPKLERLKAEMDAAAVASWAAERKAYAANEAYAAARMAWEAARAANDTLPSP